MPLVCGVVAVKLISPVVEAGNGSVVDSVVGNGGATIEGRLSPSETNGVLLVGRSGIVIQVVGSTWHSRARVRCNVGVARNTAGARRAFDPVLDEWPPWHVVAEQAVCVVVVIMFMTCFCSGTEGLEKTNYLRASPPAARPFL